MKHQRLRSLVAPIVAEYPSLTFHKRLLRLTPTHHLLQGFFFDDSAFSADILYLHALTLPLYVPTKHMHLTFSARLRDPDGKERWEVKDSAATTYRLAQVIRSQGLPYLHRQNTPAGFAAVYSQSAKEQNPYILEALAYSYDLAGETHHSTANLQALFEVISEYDISASPWVLDVKERAMTFRNALSNGTSLKLLEHWEATSRAVLGVDQ